jgi:hypothetical protein
VFCLLGDEPMVRLIYYLLWVAPAITFSVLTFVIVRRKMRQKFPYFFAYAIFQVISFGVQFSTYHSSNRYAYFIAYWTLAALSVGLGFAVIYEVFTDIFRPFEGLRDLGTVLFRWAAAVLVVASALMVLITPGSKGNVDIVLGCVVALERSVRIMQCGLVLLMILCAPYLGLQWRHRVFGIGTGFGLLAAIDLIAVAVLGRLGLSAQSQMYYNLAKMAAYNIAGLTWCTYFLRSEPARGPALQLAPSERWNFALSAVMHPESSSPSLPLIMGVVDRAFEKINERRGSGPSQADQ